MYTFVEDKVVRGAAKAIGNELMTQLVSRLAKKEGIQADSYLIGSGANNLITQNGEEPFDLDYNLKILASPVDLGKLKEAVRHCLNDVLRSHGASDCSDSTSSLTTKLIIDKNYPDDPFKIDVGIVKEDKIGRFFRLIHDKKNNPDRFYWVIALNSERIAEKVDAIKEAGWWDAVREDYLERKNSYLVSNDYQHPSFICYIETINDIYNQLNQKTGLLL